ncbi:MAG: SBBP repeat-containing protein [Planctomycetes bacterium]|nr:SBBP repeat-containing protein [Planctomycetota bacterium]
MAFIENDGQVSDEARYVTTVGGARIYFTDNGFRMHMMGRNDDGKSEESGSASQQSNIREACVVFTFEGASSGLRISSTETLLTKNHFFRGCDHNRWVPEVVSFHSIRYEDVYEGVSSYFYEGESGLEYDFELQSGADVGAIAICIDGADAVSTDDVGRLAIDSPLGRVIQEKPQCFSLDRDGRRTPIQGSFRIIDSRRYGFDVELPSKYETIIIDPGLVYSTLLGVSAGYGIDVDTVGNAYVVGRSGPFNFPTTPGAFQTTANSGFAGFVSKLEPTGSNLIYSTFLDGISSDQSNGIKVGQSGDTYVVGTTGSSDFPVTTGAFQTTNTDASAFVTHLNPTGSGLLYSTFLGGSNVEYGNAIAVDAAGNAYVTGTTLSTNFPTTVLAYDTTHNGNGTYDVFVTRFNSSGTGVYYSTYLGGKKDESGRGIAVDSAGAAYVTGETGSNNYPTTGSAFQATFNSGPLHAFVTKLDPSGGSLAYSTFLEGSLAAGGTGEDFGQSITAESTGNVYISGWTETNDFPTTPGAFQASAPQPVSSGNGNAFVVKLHASGGYPIYSTYVGGSGSDTARVAGPFADGSLLIGGSTTSADFPVSIDAYDTTSNGGYNNLDAWIGKIDPTGSALIYSTYFGGSAAGYSGINPGEDYAQSLAFFGNTTAFATGLTYSPDFPTTPGAFQTQYNFGQNGITDENAFIARFDLPDAPFGQSRYGTGTPGCSGPHNLIGSMAATINNPNFTLVCSNAPPFSLGLGLATDVQDPIGTDIFGIGVPMLVGFTGSQVYAFDFVSNGTGTGQSPVPIANDPSLIGQTFYLQAIWYWPSGPCTPSSSLLSGSNGLQMTIVQ